MSTNLMTAHQQWASRPSDQRFETLAALTASVADRRSRSRSLDVDLGKVAAKAEVFEDGNAIVINSGIQQVSPSHWSFGQLSSWIQAPAEYLRRLPAPLAVENINHGIQAVAKERGTLKFMTVEDPDGETNVLQAVTSPTYGRIWDADVCACAGRIVEHTGGRFFNPKAYVDGAIRPSGLYASDRDVFIFMIDGGSLLDIGPRAQLNRGFIMSNSETGARTFTLTTFLFNQVCGNHIIWGASDVKELRIRHTSGGPTRFDTEATPGLLAYVNRPASIEESIIRKAQAYLLPEKEPDKLIAWLQGKAFTKPEARGAIDFAKAEEGDCRTLWHVVQGATAYARGFDFVDARTALETKAGKLLDIVAGN